MSKTFSLSLSLVLALGACSVSKAGGLFHKEDGCATCGLASPQGPVTTSVQAPMASPQGECFLPTEKKCSLFSGMGHKATAGWTSLCAKMKPKPKTYTYEWVLKKKRVWGHHADCGSPTCETCGIYPSGQGYSSPQGYPSPQAYGSGQAGTYGSGQAGYGSGQITAVPTSGSMAAAPAGDEAPPPPVAEAPASSLPGVPSMPSVPSVPGTGPQSSLLFSTPSGN